MKNGKLGKYVRTYLISANSETEKLTCIHCVAIEEEGKHLKNEQKKIKAICEYTNDSREGVHKGSYPTNTMR